MKRLIALSLTLAMVFAFTACGSNNTATDDPTASGDEAYTLTFSYFAPEIIGPGLFIQDAAKNIEERSNGRLKLDMYFNSTLLGPGDVISGCMNGTADIVMVDQSIMGEVFPLSNVFSMPFLETPPSKQKMDEAFGLLLAERPELSEELAAQGLMYLNIAPCGGFHLHGTSTLFDTPAKLAGKTVDGLGEGGNIISALGGNGVTLQPGDWYLSLSTSLLDGILQHFAVLTGFALSDVLTTHVIFSNTKDSTDYDALFGGGIYAPMMGNIMNKASFDALPPDLQAILLDEMSRFAEYVTAVDSATTVKESIDVCNARGDVFIFVGDEEREIWKPGMQVIIDKWLEQVNALGYDGLDLYNHLLSLF